MNQPEPDSVKNQELITVAQSMLLRKINLIDGMRQIVVLRFATGDPGNKVFLPIRGIESETETFPLGEVRGKFSRKYLEKLDAEMANYLLRAESDIFRACRESLETFS